MSTGVATAFGLMWFVIFLGAWTNRQARKKNETAKEPNSGNEKPAT